MYPVYFPLMCLAITVTGTNGAAVRKRLFNGVGLTPAMGWNNYNSGLQPDAANVLATANAFISLGLKDLGYEYINCDDGWPAETRDAAGNLVPNPTFFPNGIANVTAEIHALGLKFGLYGDSGTTTCSGFPGSQGYEEQDAAQLSAWGVDYWKYDNCATPGGDSEPRYALMGTELAAQSHAILYSLCQWGLDEVYEWGASVGNSWRVGGDITNAWSSVASIAGNNAPIASYAQPGGFNDFDMMEIGNGQLTEEEERAHFGLWAISKSPLLLGTDLTKISATSLATISNSGVISINQDSLGAAATTFQPTGQPAHVSGTLYPYWSGPLSDGYVIGLVAANSAATLSVSFSDVPGLGAGTFSWTELYTGVSGTGTSVSATLALHDMAVFKIVTGKPGSVGSTTTTSVKPSSTSIVVNSTSTVVKTSTVAVPSTTTVAVPTSTSTASATVWSQCGGIAWDGPAICISSTCTYENPYYSQCLPDSDEGEVQVEKVKRDVSATAVPLPTSTATMVLWGQCGGQGWDGPTICISSTCIYISPYYSQCVPYGSFDGYVQGEKVKIDPSATVVSLPTSTTLSVMWEQCGGIGWGGPFACIPSQTCVFEDAWYSQCRPTTVESDLQSEKVKRDTSIVVANATIVMTPTPTTATPSPLAAEWGQCGGRGWPIQSPTACVDEIPCIVLNPYYSECLTPADQLLLATDA